MNLQQEHSIVMDLGALLMYPGDDTLITGRRLLDTVRFAAPSAATGIERFLSSAETLTVGELEELYTRTFDLSPVCIPYIGIHCFGEHEEKRRALLGRLKEVYTAVGYTVARNELPDHIGVLMQAWVHFSQEERKDLISFCLAKTLRTMLKDLKKAESLYAHLIRAVLELINISPLEDAA